MPEPIEPDATPDEETPDETPVEAAPADLGDAGKKALDAMKAKWKAAELTAKSATDELAKRDLALAAKDKPADEIALDAARREGTETANKAANLRVVKSEIKLAAKGLANPADALAFIDASTFEVDANGDVDSDALNEAITALLVARPYLAAGKQPAFQGGGDGGANRKAKPLETAAELANASLAAGDVRGSILHKMSGLKPIPSA